VSPSWPPPPGAAAAAPRPACETVRGEPRSRAASSMIPSTDRVHDQADASRVHPSSSSRVSAAGTRLRRRLSISFHCDSMRQRIRCRQGTPPAVPVCALSGNTPQQPPGELPIAANPAVAAAHVGAVARRVILIQLHIAQQSGAGVASLEKIVTEDAILRKAPAKRLLEGIDVVDSLADERAFAEHVLVDIRGARACTGRCPARRHTGAHSASGSSPAG
jgi:hypothetical protein